MSLKTIIAGTWARRRDRAIRKECLNPKTSQERTLRQLLEKAKATHIGREYGFNSIRNTENFRTRVPVRDYEAASTYFERISRGEKNVTWPGIPLYLAKTSGTISGAKYIPITRDSIRYQVKGARDALLLHIHRTSNPDFLNGKMMFLSGSPALETNEYGLKVGRLSGIMNHHVPAYLNSDRIPVYKTNCIEDWEKKVEGILDEAIPEDLRLISGIPPWVQMFFETLQNRNGKLPLEQWPNLSVFVQGGVDYKPYKNIFDKFFANKVDVVEVFPASEGFFAFQDGKPGEGLLVNLNSGIFFEFIPAEEYGQEKPNRVLLHEVELGKPYVLVVSTNAGLWAYDVGDMVKFVSILPPRLIVMGRIKQFISAFGEHVIEEEVNKAMDEACKLMDVAVNEFTVAPKVSEVTGGSCHEWFVEFSKAPDNIQDFAIQVDASVRRQNNYYNDLRTGGMLKTVSMRKLKLNAFREYMKSIGKQGGQNKMPRLKNSREVADKIVEWEIN